MFPYNIMQDPTNAQLPNTALINRPIPNNLAGNMYSALPSLQCINQEAGQFIAQDCLGSIDATNAIAPADINPLSCIGTGIGNAIWCTGTVVDVLANTTDNPTGRIAAMMVADTLTTTGTAILYTPGVSTLVGAAVIGEPLSSATVTTAMLASLCATPLSFGQAVVLYFCFHANECAPTTAAVRFTQYHDVNAIRVARQESQQRQGASTSAHMI